MDTLSIAYKHKTYRAAVREKYFVTGKEYYIILEDEALRRVLGGDPVIKEQDGILECDSSGSREKVKLLGEIRRLLDERLLEECIY